LKIVIDLILIAITEFVCLWAKKAHPTV